ncbi:glycosyltransferase family 4 protein [Rhizobium sp. TH2]|uniref:glycosyltransferase family 4 protein n=1 Tax=Rhizobium sp. TH2 TaxID=2775403 RepID=UPI002157F7EA|nr:glycosyltransferase family 4 protein [Rhizobium sp. TH2]UVC10746.1 glycosyltransferase family 4 protein [Rhizobium sp. TH2]
MTTNAQLNILQVLEPSGGGSGRHFVDLCGALAGSGHNVTAIYSATRAEQRFVDELTAQPLQSIIAVPMSRAPSTSDFAAWRAINRVMREHGPFDVVHGHSSKAGALTRIRFPGRHVPRIYTPHAFRTMDPTLGKGGRRIYGMIESLLGRHFSDAVICVSEDEKKHAATALGIPERLLHTVINGVDQTPPGDREEIRAQLGVRPENFVFGFVGRLSPQKAPERLIEAFRRIAADRADIELAIVGFGELLDDVKIQILEAGLSDRVHVTSDIPGAQAMQAFDALIMPSRYEAMSYVMLEGAAAGLPMVLTDVGGATTVVDHGFNGFIVPNDDDPHELAEAMRTLSTAEGFDAMRHAAEARRNRYSLDVMARQTEAVYRHVLAAR